MVRAVRIRWTLKGPLRSDTHCKNIALAAVLLTVCPDEVRVKAGRLVKTSNLVWVGGEDGLD